MNKLVIATFAFLAKGRFASGAAFAVSSSSSSPKKTKVSNQGKAAGGFGKTVKAPSIHDPDTSDTTQNLIKYLSSQKSKGIGTEGCGNEIGFHKETGIRGLYATKNIKKGEIICRIPSDLALALSDPQFGGDDVPTIAHGGRNYIVFYKEDPQACALWSPYLDTLPTKDVYFDPTPDYYSDKEIEALEFPRAVENAKERKQQIKDLAEKEVRVSQLSRSFFFQRIREAKVSVNLLALFHLALCRRAVSLHFRQ
mmetsp:Transcript_53245/g.159406  ORF Transcript_53245/g.159406 Transcript_53245/m.159406 type:complete len:253 (-) Transcript_53245:2219-2977(-)